MVKEKKAPFHHTEIEHHDDGSHTVKHHPHVTATKSGAFMDRGEPTSYSAGDGKELFAKMGKHLGIGAAKAAPSEEKEVEAAEHEPPHESDQEEEEIAEGE